MDRFIGRLLDNRYEILEVIGVGGMAVVYKARCHRLNRLVAIKILKDEYLRDDEFRRRFQAESQAVAMLSHPNIVSVYDVSSFEGSDYIVMELIEGITLKQYMEKKGMLNWREALHFAMQIGKALEHAHSRGIVHRDIKPHNVMILKNGSVKVTDFGIARVMSATNTLTKEALGSVHYISPEQAKGGRVDNRSDLYSLGVVMYEMLCGRPPYDGDSPIAVAIKHINGGAIKPTILNPNIPLGMEQIILKAMSVDLESRYQSATQMLADMEAFRSAPTMALHPSGAAVASSTMTAAASAAPTAPRTAAERVAGVRTTPTRTPGTESARTGSPSRSASHAAAERKREEEKRRKKMLILIGGGCVVIFIALIFLIVLLVTGKGNSKTEPSAEKIRVPGLVGEMWSDDLYDEYDEFTLETVEEYDEDAAYGKILRQDPSAWSLVEPGTTITLVISCGGETTEVPKLVGTVYEELDPHDYTFTFEVKDKQYSDEYPEGQIMEQSPKEGTQASVDATIELVVSLGPKTGKLANLTELTEQQARDNLNAMELELKIRVEEETSDEIAEGSVIRTDPEASTELTKGQTVTLYISTGKEMTKVPNVKGMTLNTAMDVLDGRKLTYDFQYAESDRPKDEVIEQSIPSNTEVAVNTEIILTLSNGVSPTEPTETTQPVVSGSIKYTLSLPVNMTDTYALYIKDPDSGETVAEQREFSPEETSVEIVLPGGTDTGVFHVILVTDGSETIYKVLTVDYTTGAVSASAP